ncbi:MAG: hypothetical protein ABR600_11890 [Actinomycetota bacterium]
MLRGRWARTFVLVAGTALAVTAIPAAARTVVDFARNAGHVDGWSAVSADASRSARAGKLVATDDNGRLPNSIIARAQDSARLGGLGAGDFVLSCGQGGVTGYAQVPANVAATWSTVEGYGHSSFSIGPSFQGGPSSCRSEEALARRISAGVYQVSLNSSLAWACQMADAPRAGERLPAVVSVASTEQLSATYTTVCDPDDKGFVEEVRIRAADGTPSDSAFTLATLQPVRVAEP